MMKRTNPKPSEWIGGDCPEAKKSKENPPTDM
jgi:hypothetical protein